MKQDITEWLINTGLMTIGYYARIIFGADKFNWRQLVALYAFGIGIVAIVNQLSLQTVYKLSIVMVAGLILPNIIRAFIKSGNSSEDTVSKKISKKIKDLID